MLKIPKKVEYAVLALKYIAENSAEQSLSTKLIADNADIPYYLTAKILQRLVKCEIIKSRQGTKGGYSLNISANELNLGQIASAVEEDILLTNCMFDNASSDDCTRIDNCCIRSPLNNLQEKINYLFNTTYLKEII